MRAHPWFWLVVSAWLGGAPMARALVPWSWSYGRLSTDGKRLLVMTTGKSDRHSRDQLLRLPDGRELALREVFQKSGVYEADTLAPVWQVDWYTYQSNLAVSPDLDSLAVVRELALSYPELPALAFFHQGKPVRTYACSQLLGRLNSKELFHPTSFTSYREWCGKFEAHGNAVTLTTAPRSIGAGDWRLNLGWRDVWVFDLRTGAAVERRTVGKLRLTVTIVAVVALLAAPFLIALHRRRKGVKSG